MLSKPSQEERQEQPYVAIRTAVPIPFGKYLQPLWDEVNAWLKTQAIASPGAAMIRYLTTDMSKKLDIDVGFAIGGRRPGNGHIIEDVLPAGQYATLLNTGHYRGKGIYQATVALVD